MNMHRDGGIHFDRLSLPLLAVLLSLYIVFGRQVLMKAPPHGDESHYLMMAVSLSRDGDLNLWNNYEEKAYLAFQKTPLLPHRVTFGKKEVYSSHAPGVAALIALPYRLGGRWGAVLLMNILAALAVWGIYPWGLRLGFGRAVSAVITLIPGTTLPWLMMSGMIFPEVPATVCLVWSLGRIREDMPPEDIWLSMILFSALPWFHIKFAVFSVFGFVLLLFALRASLRAVIVPLIVPLVSCVSLFYLQYEMFGDALYLVKLMHSGFNSPWRGLIGLFLDREAGLLAFSPVFILWFFHIPLLKKHDSVIRRMDTLLILYWMLSSSWVDWHSGHCPPARYLVPLIPVMSMGIGLFLTRVARPIRIAVPGVLWLLSLFQVVGVIMTIPEAAIVVGDGVNRIWLFNGISKSHPFPTFLSVLPGQAWLAAGWVLLIAAGIVGVWRHSAPSTFPRRALERFLIPVGCLAGILCIAAGFYQESAYHRVFAETPLSKKPPILIAPPPESVWKDHLPELRWKQVQGADGYLWEIRFPGGTSFSSEVYRKTAVKLPDSVLFAIPDGQYKWRIVPLREGKWGTPSSWNTFTIERPSGSVPDDGPAS